MRDLVRDHFLRRNVEQRLDDYIRWRLRLHYDVGPFSRLSLAMVREYMRLGGHPAEIFASVGMRGGVVWKMNFSVTIETHGSEFDGWDYGLIGSVETIPRFETQTNIDSSLNGHIDYEIGQPGGCEICVMGWVKFTPYADDVDIKRLMQFDLSCLTRSRSCEKQMDLMPTAWAQHLAESSSKASTAGPTTCTAPLMEALGRDMGNIGIGQILSLEPVKDFESQVRIRAIERLKGRAEWKPGNVYDVTAYRLNGNVQAGPRVFVFGGPYLRDRMYLDFANPCTSAPMSGANRKLLESGIAQDYSSEDDVQWPSN